MRVGTRALLSGRALECAGGAGGALWWHCAVLTARKRRSACDLHDESHDSRLDAGAGGVGARELLFDEKTPDEKKNCFMRPITNATDSFTFDVRRFTYVHIHTLEIVDNNEVPFIII